ncbi:MAG: hypothetical protein C4516_04665 [Oxalobacter sp.]|nr:MAG: hypothetical protein C4516_04665 [Oxalobacter sp.]
MRALSGFDQRLPGAVAQDATQLRFRASGMAGSPQGETDTIPTDPQQPKLTLMFRAWNDGIAARRDRHNPPSPQTLAHAVANLT